MQLFYESIATLLVPVLSGFLALSGWAAAKLEPLIDTYTPFVFSEHIESILSIDQDHQYEQVANVANTATEPTISKEQILQALVNVYCTYTEDTTRHVSTGSGVWVDADGVALTSAHVVEGLLREGVQQASCVLRTGTSTVRTYETELLYAPAAWTAQDITHTNGTSFGTGEHDFALLVVTDAAHNEEAFASLETEVASIDMKLAEETLHASGYARSSITSENPAILEPLVESINITHFYTFGSGYIDLIAVNGITAFKTGASGGPVVDASGSIRGIMTTLGNERVDGAESMRALTLPYIDRVIRAETGAGLEQLISEVSEEPAN